MDRADQPPFQARGASVRIRRVRPSDTVALATFYAGLSAESRQTRFLGVCSGIRDTEARHFCVADHEHRDGFVAVTGGPGANGDANGRIVGHLCLEPAGPATEEVAVVVADAWQRRGIGRRLFTRALAWSGRRGVHRVVATAFSWNSPVLHLLSSAPGGATVRQLDGGVVSVVLTIPPSWRPAGRAASGCPTGRGHHVS